MIRHDYVAEFVYFVGINMQFAFCDINCIFNPQLYAKDMKCCNVFWSFLIFDVLACMTMISLTNLLLARVYQAKEIFVKQKHT